MMPIPSAVDHDDFLALLERPRLNHGDLRALLRRTLGASASRKQERNHPSGVSNMYVGRDFGPANQGECKVYSLDFVNELRSGETINSVAAVCLTVFQGTDVNPNSHLAGNPSISGTVVSQRIGGQGAPGGGLIAGVTYTFSITVNTSLGNGSNIITLYSRIACRPAL